MEQGAGSPPVEPTARDEGAPAEQERSSIQSIDRAASVLALLNQDTRTLSAAHVAESLGMNRTTAHRYLQSLQRAGFLGQTYGPGPLMDQLAALVSVREQIMTLAPAVMRQLSDTAGLTSVLSFLGPSGAVVTHVEEAQTGTIVLTVRVGTVLEPRAAQTRVLLAFESDPSAMARTHAPLTSKEAVMEREALGTVRRHRIAWGDLDRVGLASVAVPVFSARAVSAAMCLLGTSTMLNPTAGSADRVRALETAAETLGSMLAG